MRMSADGKPTRGRTRSLTDSARKRNRREVLVNYNKARINNGHQHGHWMELVWLNIYLTHYFSDNVVVRFILSLLEYDYSQ
jgi:hypothetical protein